MKTLRRYNIADSVYFITMVTFNRNPILTNEKSLFWNCWENIDLDAWVILPDHTHLILSNDDLSISKIIHRFKTKYSRHFRDRFRPGRVWQNRFWDHVIRDENDLRRHLDYIHFNPVKHGIVAVGQDPRPTWSFHCQSGGLDNVLPLPLSQQRAFLYPDVKTPSTSPAWQ